MSSPRSSGIVGCFATMRDFYSPLRLRPDREASETVRRVTMQGPGQFPAFVGRVIANPTRPAASNLYYSVNPVAVLGIEAEGSPATLVPDTATTVLVCVLGSEVPVIGDDLLCRFVENRWVAERYGSRSHEGGASIPGCACLAIPTVLYLTAVGPCEGIFQACVLQYGPTPAEFSGLDLGANCFLSTETFFDEFAGVSYRYHFGCDTNFFRISRVYEPSVYGGPIHDASIYSWSINHPGNTCNPFLLSSGSIFSGGNTNCIVRVNG